MFFSSVNIPDISQMVMNDIECPSEIGEKLMQTQEQNYIPDMSLILEQSVLDAQCTPVTENEIMETGIFLLSSVLFIYLFFNRKNFFFFFFNIFIHSFEIWKKIYLSNLDFLFNEFYPFEKKSLSSIRRPKLKPGNNQKNVRLIFFKLGQGHSSKCLKKPKQLAISLMLFHSETSNLLPRNKQ